MTRTRLSPQRRRDQLLDLGAAMFAARPYADVGIEDVAREAGVSRGLPYHYFPTKRAFFLALLSRECARLAELTRGDPAIGVVDRLRQGLDAYLSYCAGHADGIKLIYSGWASADPDVQAIVTADLRVHEDRVLAALSPVGTPPHPLARIAVRGWIAFVRSACLEWLDRPDVERAAVRELCAATLLTALAALPDGVLPALPSLTLDRSHHPVESDLPRPGAAEER